MRKQHNKVKAENGELQQKAALADVYSDEMESLREKVSLLMLNKKQKISK